MKENWIPVSDHNPKEKGDYIVTFDTGMVDMCYFRGASSWAKDSHYHHVIAWMEKPKAYMR